MNNLTNSRVLVRTVVGLLLAMATSALPAATFRCPEKVTAYDPKSPENILGIFEAQTELQVGEILPNGMAPVTYHAPDGKIIEALCQAKDVGLAKPEASKPDVTKTESTKPPEQVKTDDLAKGLRLASNGKKFLFVKFGRPNCGNCQALGKLMESEQVHLPAERFVVADVNCDDTRQNQLFYKKFKIEGNTLPFVVIADSGGHQLAAHSGYGAADEFNDFIRNATTGKP